MFRVECFHAILPIVADYIDRLNPPKEQQAQNEQPPEHSESERLLQLLVKGLLYESAVDYCQAQALEGKNGFFKLNKNLMFFSAKAKVQVHKIAGPSGETLARRSFTHFLA